MSPTLQAPVKLATLRSYFFVSFRQIMITLGIFPNFKALFLSGSTDFCLLVPAKCGKNRGTKQQLCMCITLFSKFLWRSLHNDVKPPNATFYGGSERTTTNFPSSFLTWINVLKNSTPGEIAGLHLTVWAGRIEVWTDANSFFSQRFQCRHRCHCLSFLSSEKQGLNQPIATTGNKRCYRFFITAFASDHHFSENNISK